MHCFRSLDLTRLINSLAVRKLTPAHKGKSDHAFGQLDRVSWMRCAMQASTLSTQNKARRCWTGASGAWQGEHDAGHPDLPRRRARRGAPCSNSWKLRLPKPSREDRQPELSHRLPCPRLVFRSRASSAGIIGGRRSGRRLSGRLPERKRSPCVAEALSQKPRMLVVIAFATKMARAIWTMATRKVDCGTQRRQ